MTPRLIEAISTHRHGDIAGDLEGGHDTFERLRDFGVQEVAVVHPALN
jgi:hypothetical protein